jgi:glycosyltransferase involved in cell wall biosynthesis
MRLAFVVSGGLHPSGREQVIPALLGLLERLARRHEVHAFALRHLKQPSSYVLRGINVHDLGYPGRGKLRGRWNEWRAFRVAFAHDGPFDVVHGYWIDPGGLLAAIAGRRFGVPSVVTCDSGEFSDDVTIGYGMQRTAGPRALVRIACRLAGRIHVATRYMQQLAARRGFDALQIPIGVDLTPFRLASTRSERPPWKLLNVASLNRVKDHATLLDALSIACREIDVRLDLVGEDTLNGAVQAHAAQVGIADRVTFWGFRPYDELPAFYHAAHVYVQSSRHEAAGAAVLEAAAAALPVVGTRVGYVADWAPDAAVAVEPGDASALARAMVDTVKNAEMRAQLASRAHAFAEAHDVDWTAGELEKLYQSLARTPST